MTDVLNPGAAILVKLGSIVVHADELLNDVGVQTTEEGMFDVRAIQSLLSDPDVHTWIEQADKMALLPKKRRLG